jgi:hypothetical protein
VTGDIKTTWIVVRKGIVPNVCIGVDASSQAYRVALDVFSRGRVIISVVVLVQAALGLIVLSREAKVADSTPCQAMIPRDVGPAFHGKPGQDSTASRAG